MLEWYIKIKRLVACILPLTKNKNTLITEEKIQIHPAITKAPPLSQYDGNTQRKGTQVEKVQVFFNLRILISNQAGPARTYQHIIYSLSLPPTIYIGYN